MDWHNEMFTNRHAGETVVIIANGPSLNKVDFERVRKEICIGLNKIYLGFEKFGFYPKYYVAVNEKVLRQSYDRIEKINCVKFLSNRSPDLYKPSGLTHIINTTQPPARFSTSLSAGLHEGWTVTYAALQIAYVMGFTKVVLIGLDHRFEFSGQPNEANLLVGPDKNHFSDEYFSNQKWDNPDLNNSEESYTLARKMFETAGRQIIDATIDGACTIFEKAELADALVS